MLEDERSWCELFENHILIIFILLEGAGADFQISPEGATYATWCSRPHFSEFTDQNGPNRPFVTSSVAIEGV